MFRTREQLAMLGIWLLGPIVPEWFKKQSDGGSVPFGRVGKWLFVESQWRAAAFIHDFRYWLIALQWTHKSPAWVGARMEADFEFKKNRKKSAKRRWLAPFQAMYCFRAVRAGGRVSIHNSSEIAVPATLADVEEIEAMLEPAVTALAAAQIVKWKELRG